MKGIKAAMRELAAALAVIAVFALTFVYQPFMPALTNQDASSLLASSQYVLCGGGPTDDGSNAHGPCHACRSKIAILPPPPDDAVPAFTSFVAHDPALEDETPARVFFASHYNPRAPPFAV